MCGIVSGVAQRDIAPILLEGLKRLEYRGYDSAGMATIDDSIKHHKELGKVVELENQLNAQPLAGHIGIAHTRWATHGKPSKENAHPHFSLPVALVHNGIIENHEELREKLTAQGYTFSSQTDSEVVAHLIHQKMQAGDDLLNAVKNSIAELDGAYALAVISEKEPNKVIGARKGSPLVLGVGIGETFLASDQLALRQVTDRFIYLDEGDLVEVTEQAYKIWDKNDVEVQREIEQIKDEVDSADKAGYRHFMLKEIFEQPKVIAKTLEGRVSNNYTLLNSLGAQADEIFSQVEAVQIIACGTSYHSGIVAKYWFEEYAGLPCSVEVASEYRYRKVVVPKNVLLITISQSGETADTLAALKQSKEQNFLASLTVCNVAQSSLVRESDLAFLTQAGPEIGVASTKAFTTQLVALLLCVLTLAKHRGLSTEDEKTICKSLTELPEKVSQCLALEEPIKRLADDFTDKHHTLFLGRGTMYPVAMEGALKLKEISYIHAEAYPAGELKHGPLALVDEHMPIVSVAPNNDLLEKLKSNLEEVQARGGILYVFADADADFKAQDSIKLINVPHVEKVLEPILYTIPLQLLSYYVAVNKGTDVDQPRNLAKSVTVE